jgi:CrcB protein
MNQSALRAALAVSLGAISGALSRYYLGQWLAQVTNIHDFPIGTLGANLLGCFLMGVFVAAPLNIHYPISSEARLMIATGFFGVPHHLLVLRTRQSPSPGG